jgi:NADH dehydrogenase
MKVVVIGGGFGGISAVRAFEGAEGIEVTLIDRRNFHLFQPLLYQVATGGLSPANIASPLRGIVRKQKNVHVVLEEVTGFDLQNKRVITTDSTIDYDALIVATGSHYNYFGHPEWEKVAPSLKTIEDATEIRSRILHAFEEAEMSTDEAETRRWMTFVIVGGGPTGVELAGAIAELARTTLPGDFRHIEAGNARILLVEADPRILPPYPPSLSQHAVESLNDLGADVLTNSRVTGIDERGITMVTADGEQRIESKTVIWAAGVVGTAMGKTLADAADRPLGRGGRIEVEPDLTIPGQPAVYVIGDLASLEQDGKPIPALAPVAMQQGAYAARTIIAKHADRSMRPFRYHDRGTMATIGRSSAVAQIGPLRLHGLIGWLAWLTVHLTMLMRFENRVLVFTQWAWNYFTRGRSARLITGEKYSPSSSTSRRKDA